MSCGLFVPRPRQLRGGRRRLRRGSGPGRDGDKRSGFMEMRNSHPLWNANFHSESNVKEESAREDAHRPTTIGPFHDSPHRPAHPPRRPVNGLGPDPLQGEPRKASYAEPKKMRKSPRFSLTTRPISYIMLTKKSG